MDEIRLSENFAEMKSNQAHLTEAISTLNIAVAEITTTLKQLVETQKRQYDLETRVAVLEREQVEQKTELDKVCADIKEERKGRKSDIMWIGGLLFSLFMALLIYALPHLHFK